MARIAVIDGNPDIAEIVVSVLAEAGHEPVIIDGARGAVDRLTRDNPDLLILDPWLATPMAGWEILAVLLSDERTRAIPIIVYTGDSHLLEDHEQWLQDHDVTVLEKPFTLDDLEDTVAAKLAG